MSDLLVCLPDVFATGVNKIRNQDGRIVLYKTLEISIKHHASIVNCRLSH
jgi:hypothetical protein